MTFGVGCDRALNSTHILVMSRKVEFGVTCNTMGLDEDEMRIKLKKKGEIPSSDKSREMKNSNCQKSEDGKREQEKKTQDQFHLFGCVNFSE